MSHKVKIKRAFFFFLPQSPQTDTYESVTQALSALLCVTGSSQKQRLPGRTQPFLLAITVFQYLYANRRA